jgi:Holliday junction resolvase RusA-like endonuclease
MSEALFNPFGFAPAPAALPPEPAITVIVRGRPAPQGSKKPFRNQYTGRIQMTEQSTKVKPWRQDVKYAAIEATDAIDGWEPLDGPLVGSIVFTVSDRPASKPVWWPRGVRWSKTLMWRPASAPDLSKLLRSTEDALKGVVWRDDARVVGYRRLEKYFCGDSTGGRDVLATPGAVIRVWQLS